MVIDFMKSPIKDRVNYIKRNLKNKELELVLLEDAIHKDADIILSTKTDREEEVNVIFRKDGEALDTTYSLLLFTYGVTNERLIFLVRDIAKEVDYLFHGIIVNADGKNVTSEIISEYKPN